MKVIEPLFLNEFKEKFEFYKNNPKKLESLLRRLEKIKIFDPACGSGNFLIISYASFYMNNSLILNNNGYLSDGTGTRRYKNNHQQYQTK